MKKALIAILISAVGLGLVQQARAADEVLINKLEPSFVDCNTKANVYRSLLAKQGQGTSTVTYSKSDRIALYRGAMSDGTLFVSCENTRFKVWMVMK